jgi:hypothetical protein
VAGRVVRVVSREWKPGEVAVYVTSSGRRVVGVMTHGEVWNGVDEYGDTYMNRTGIPAKTLAVIDPEDREQVEALAALASHQGIRYGGLADERVIADHLTAALREFANPTPPKPPEPQGLGAVVEDEKGQRFTRVGVNTGCWIGDGKGLNGYTYREIAAVKVLRKGWSE